MGNDLGDIGNSANHLMSKLAIREKAKGPPTVPVASNICSANSCPHIAYNNIIRTTHRHGSFLDFDRFRIFVNDCFHRIVSFVEVVEGRSPLEFQNGPRQESTPRYN